MVQRTTIIAIKNSKEVAIIVVNQDIGPRNAVHLKIKIRIKVKPILSNPMIWILKICVLFFPRATW